MGLKMLDVSLGLLGRRPSRRDVLAVLCCLLFAAAPANAQEAGTANSDAAAEPTQADAVEEPIAYSEIQALIEGMQARLNNINTLSRDADAALDTLDDQVEEAIDKLTTRGEENVALRDRATGLTTELDTLATTHDELSAALAKTEDERESVEERLQGEINALSGQLALERDTIAELEANLTDLSQVLDITTTDRDQLNEELVVASRFLDNKEEVVSSQALELASLRDDIETLREVRTDLEGQVAALSLELESDREVLLAERNRAVGLAENLASRSDALLQSREQLVTLNEALDRSRSSLQSEKDRNQSLVEELGQVRDRSKALETRLAEESERTVLAQREIGARDIRVQDLLKNVAAARQIAASQRRAATDSQDRVSLLNQQLAELRNQLILLNGALEASEDKNVEQQAQIVNLGTRLNQALATKVQELASYRSEFFGRLREVLGGRSDVQIVGDRFVIQSEVLFETGSADLGEEGRAQLDDLAAALSTIAVSIPPGVDWILRVDGHTDERPISTEQFPSNWELSAARALSVVNFLIDHSIAPNRLVAAGFGQFHPLDPREDEIAFRRNRRIEFKLTQR